MHNRIQPQSSRSRDLVSMESELRFLLTHSNLTDIQRNEFMGLLECIFDLFLTPVRQPQSINSRGYMNYNQRNDREETIALIDLSNVELFSKMQNLVSALTVLIMNEDDESNMSYLHDITQDLPVQMERNSYANHDYQSRTLSSLKYNGNDRSPFALKKSPSFHSENLPQFRDHSQSYRNSYQNSNDRFQDFKVLSTPVPRTFSDNRPHSMYFDKSHMMKTPTPSSSPSIFNRESSLSGGNSSRKRYSMRF